MIRGKVACFVGVCIVWIGSGQLLEGAVSQPISALTAEQQAQEQALLAENPYKDKPGQISLPTQDEEKVGQFIGDNKSKIKELAYAGGKLTWRGVKKAAKFVRSSLGLGFSLAGQIFKMVVVYAIAGVIVGVTVPIVRKALWPL